VICATCLLGISMRDPARTFARIPVVVRLVERIHPPWMLGSSDVTRDNQPGPSRPRCSDVRSMQSFLCQRAEHFASRSLGREVGYGEVLTKNGEL
jgi:hypothetical protein